MHEVPRENLSRHLRLGHYDEEARDSLDNRLARKYYPIILF